VIVELVHLRVFRKEVLGLLSMSSFYPLLNLGSINIISSK
jgi:hypothetical protein